MGDFPSTLFFPCCRFCLRCTINAQQEVAVTMNISSAVCHQVFPLGCSGRLDPSITTRCKERASEILQQMRSELCFYNIYICKCGRDEVEDEGGFGKAVSISITKEMCLHDDGMNIIHQISPLHRCVFCCSFVFAQRQSRALWIL